MRWAILQSASSFITSRWGKDLSHQSACACSSRTEAGPLTSEERPPLPPPTLGNVYSPTSLLCDEAGRPGKVAVTSFLKPMGQRIGSSDKFPSPKSSAQQSEHQAPRMCPWTHQPFLPTPGRNPKPSETPADPRLRLQSPTECMELGHTRCPPWGSEKWRDFPRGVPWHPKRKPSPKPCWKRHPRHALWSAHF